MTQSLFLEAFDYDFPLRIRQVYFRKRFLATDPQNDFYPLTESLLVCAEDGLKSRGFGEEVHLAPLREKLDKLNTV